MFFLKILQCLTLTMESLMNYLTKRERNFFWLFKAISLYFPFF